MSRYRSQRFQTAARSHSLSIESTLAEFFAYHERKGDSTSYLSELCSYLIGGTKRYGKTRAWHPLLPWSRQAKIGSVAALDRSALESYLDYVRSLATRSDYGKVCAILKRLLGFLVLDGILDEAPMRIDQPKRMKAEAKVFTEDEMLRLRDVVIKETPRDLAIWFRANERRVPSDEIRCYDSRANM